MKHLITVFTLLLIILLVPAFVLANGEETCPDGDGWTKVNSGDLSQHPVNGAVEYCFKFGSSNAQGCDGGISPVWPPDSEDFPNPCGLSHWSYLLADHTVTPDPTVTPTDVPPTATPTDVPPTATPTDVPPTATPTDVPPTATPTDVPAPTPTNPPPPNTGPSVNLLEQSTRMQLEVSSAISIPAINFETDVVNGHYDGAWVFSEEYYDGTFWSEFNLLGLHFSQYVNLIDVEIGDTVYFDNEVFIVYDTSIIWEYESWDRTRADLMLITCTGGYYLDQRIMIYTQRLSTPRFWDMLVP